MIIICGEHSWNKKAENLIASYIDEFCLEIESTELIEFVKTKKIIQNSDIIIADIDNVTPTTVEVLTIAQCYDVPVIGLCTDKRVPPRMVSLCDDIIDSNGEDLFDTILQYTRNN